MSDATWIEVSAGAGSREALVRCAIDLLAARGVEVVRAGPIEAARGGAVEAAGENENAVSADTLRCLVEVRGVAVAGAAGEVCSALEGRVRVAETSETPAAVRSEAGSVDAGSVAAALAGFVTEGIDHTADEAFAVTARDRADLLAAAAEALGALMVGPASARPSDVRLIDVRAPEEGWADDDRLFAWLCEVLYALDVGRIALRRAVVFEDDGGGVRGALFGEPIDEERHDVHGALKAVTYHGLAIEAAPGGLRAQVVIDV